ncbi:isoaspartyl peptidase L-asparaginase-like [Paramuricea clavata]|uniref:Isoaspartyl peptidase L-asparaginase-like n=1 Tax=Paramuricea clavata TaxID=317549 RepID=A0A7D9HEN0_PARCT|nr:isoaspartyl peptidase L-asparaginase-like [Paramuricea clavata]
MDESDHCTLCADGALEFAVKKNFPVEFVEGRDIPLDGLNAGLNNSPGDTVTAIAMDCKGNLACAASSGGIPGKSKGRVGDVPLVGCGGYANEYGAAAACGHGESIIRMTVAKEVVYNMQKLNQSAQKPNLTILHQILYISALF